MAGPSELDQENQKTRNVLAYIGQSDPDAQKKLADTVSMWHAGHDRNLKGIFAEALCDNDSLSSRIIGGFFDDISARASVTGGNAALSVIGAARTMMTHNLTGHSFKVFHSHILKNDVDLTLKALVAIDRGQLDPQYIKHATQDFEWNRPEDQKTRAAMIEKIRSITEPAPNTPVNAKRPLGGKYTRRTITPKQG